jgi:hypothetical protein
MQTAVSPAFMLLVDFRPHSMPTKHMLNTGQDPPNCPHCPPPPASVQPHTSCSIGKLPVRQAPHTIPRAAKPLSPINKHAKKDLEGWTPSILRRGVLRMTSPGAPCTTDTAWLPACVQSHITFTAHGVVAVLALTASQQHGNKGHAGICQWLLQTLSPAVER